MPLKVSYNHVRKCIKDGDCLLCYGNSEMSKAIKFFTGECTHVGLLEVTRGRVMVLEAVNEFRHYPLSNYLNNYNNSGKPYNGAIFIGRIRGLTEKQAEIMINTAYGDLGKPYDWESIGKIAYNQTVGKMLPKYHEDGRNKLYCSEAYNYNYFTATGRQFVEENGFVLPMDIAQSPEMQILYEVI